MSISRKEIIDYVERVFKGVKMRDTKIIFKGTTVGSKLYPIVGKDIFNRLMGEFYRHTSYTNISSDGSSKTQRMTMDRL